MVGRHYNLIWKVTEMFSAEGRKMRKQVKILDDFLYDIIDKREAKAAVGNLDRLGSGRQGIQAISMDQLGRGTC